MTAGNLTNPFFIVGSPRSGTTLLRHIMNRHSRIHIPGETGFVPFLRVPLDVRLSREQVQAVLERVGRLNRTWQDMVDDVDAFCDSLAAPRLANVLGALYLMRATKYGAERWGDKTPLYVVYMGYLSRLFPDGQFIHLIRDGRDAVLSAMERWGREKFYFDPYYLSKHWVRNVSSGRTVGKKLGSNRYLEVRYEDLVTQPEESVRSICSFLRERFEMTMLVGTPSDGSREDAPWMDPEGPVSAQHVQRWTKELSPFEKRLADHVAGPTLAAFGYPPARQGVFTARERLLLSYLAAKFALTDTVRTLGYKAGILTLNRGARAYRR